MSKQKAKKGVITREEQLVNRIMINYAIAILAYIVLYMLLNKYYMRPQVVLPLAVIMLAAGIVCYVYNKIYGKAKNYGHMFVGFTLALLAGNASFITGSIFGIDTLLKLREIRFFELIFNSQKMVVGIAWLGALYLVGMTIYNAVQILKEQKKGKSK